MVRTRRSSSTHRLKRCTLAIGVLHLLGVGTVNGQDDARAAARDRGSVCKPTARPAGIVPPTVSPEGLDLGADSTAQELYLEVFRQNRPIGLIARLCLRKGRLAATAETLRDIGIAVPGDATDDSDGLIALDGVAGLSYRYEAATQRLFLYTTSALRPTQRLGPGAARTPNVRRDAGWLLSYDAYGDERVGGYAATLRTAARRFGRFGAIELIGVSRAGEASTTYRRLETRWTYSDPVRLWTWTAGDLISGGLSWTRPVRMGGVQWRRNFGVRPDLITLPMPRLLGDATVPSSVELFVNNVRQFEGVVDDGPFVLDVLPTIAGAGEAVLFVTDAFGRVTETAVPLYVDHRRLAPGLTDFSVEAGFLRSGFGGEHDRFERGVAASASVRRGITPTFTIEGHSEIGPGVRLAGAGIVWSPANRWGLVAASVAYAAADSAGWQYSLGYQWNSSGYGIDVQMLRRDTGFRDLGDRRRIPERVEHAEYLIGPPREQDRATGWLPVFRGSVAFTGLRWRDGDGARHRTISVSLTQTISDWLSVSGFAFDDTNGGPGGGLAISVPLGGRLQAGAGIRRQQDRTSWYTTVKRNAPYRGGWGWLVHWSDRPNRYVQAAAEVRSRLGEATFGIDRSEGRFGGVAYLNGSMVWMDGRFFLSRRIHDAFAVVSTNGQADIPILSENRIYGRTGSGGYLLISDLRGWQRNLIGIDPDDLPPDYRVGALEQTATPPDHAGSMLRFYVAEIRPAIVKLLGPDHRPVSPGSRGHIVGSGQEIVAGFDGEVYIEDLSAVTLIELETGGVRCRYRVPAALTSTDGQARLGPFPCERL